MMDALHRILTGQTLTQRQLAVAGWIVVAWIAMDVVMFADFIISKLRG